MSKHYSLASEMIRTISAACRAIDVLNSEQVEASTVMALDIEQALRSVMTKLARIELPAVRDTRYPAVNRPNQLTPVNGRSPS